MMVFILSVTAFTSIGILVGIALWADYHKHRFDCGKRLRLRVYRAGSVRLDTQRAEISGACQFLLCPELSTAAVGRRLHDERPIAAVGNSHALRVV